MKDLSKKCLTEKIEFVKKVNDALVNHVGNIEGVDYVVLVSKKNDDWFDEYIVITYKGGAIQARNSNMNSCVAIFEEISKMLYSSRIYVNDTNYYKEQIGSGSSYQFIG